MLLGGNKKIKSSLILILAVLASLFLLPAPGLSVEGVPMMKVATPNTGQPGAILKVEGEYLDAEHVAKVFLTDGKTDFELEVVRQGTNKLEVKLPADMKAGKFFLMVLTTGSDGMLIEQPVKVTVVVGATREGTASE
jgi:hypothetical protein